MYYKLGWWFPDEDTHFSYMLEKNILKGIGPFYQEVARMKSIEVVKDKNVAIDIGANIGLWTRDLTKYFSKVINQQCTTPKSLTTKLYPLTPNH